MPEWSARWKRNEDFPACLGCGGSDTKEHYFVQVGGEGVGGRAWGQVGAATPRSIT